MIFTCCAAVVDLALVVLTFAYHCNRLGIGTTELQFQVELSGPALPAALGMDDCDMDKPEMSVCTVMSMETKHEGSDSSQTSHNVPLKRWVELVLPELTLSLEQLGHLGLFWEVAPRKFHRAILAAARKAQQDPVDFIVSRYCDRVNDQDKELIVSAWTLIWSELDQIGADDSKSYTSGM